MASLTQIASTIRTLAQTNLKRGQTRAYKTGNLYRTVGAKNPADKMVKEKGNSISITLDYAPDGATYGKFVNDGTSKMEARPFATNALNDPVIDRMLDDWINNNLADKIVDELVAEIDALGRR
jgi:HK97 gp10 family phage protein